MKKILVSVVALFAITLLSVVSVSAQTFKDNSSGDLYYEAIEFLSGENIVTGYPDGTFEPDATLSRAEFLTIVMRANNVPLQTVSKGNCFEDVAEGIWFYNYVCTAKAKGLVSGYKDGTFRPGDAVSFVEAQKMVMSFKYVWPTTDTWYDGLVQTAGNYNLIPITVRNFEQKLTRSEMADMVTRVIKHTKNDGADLAEYLKDYTGYRVNLYSIQRGDDMYATYKASKKVPVNPVDEPKSCTYNGGTYSDGVRVKYNSCTSCECVDGELKYCTGLCVDDAEVLDYEISSPAVWYDPDGKVRGNFTISNNTSKDLNGAKLVVKLGSISSNDNLYEAGGYNYSLDLDSYQGMSVQSAIFTLNSDYLKKSIGKNVMLSLYVNGKFYNNVTCTAETSNFKPVSGDAEVAVKSLKIWYDGKLLKSSFALKNTGTSDIEDAYLRIKMMDGKLDYIGTYDVSEVSIDAGDTEIFAGTGLIFTLESEYKNKMASGTAYVDAYINNKWAGDSSATIDTSDYSNTKYTDNVNDFTLTYDDDWVVENSWYGEILNVSTGASSDGFAPDNIHVKLLDNIVPSQYIVTQWEYVGTMSQWTQFGNVYGYSVYVGGGEGGNTAYFVKLNGGTKWLYMWADPIVSEDVLYDFVSDIRLW